MYSQSNNLNSIKLLYQKNVTLANLHSKRVLRVTVKTIWFWEVVYRNRKYVHVTKNILIRNVFFFLE